MMNRAHKINKYYVIINLSKKIKMGNHNMYNSKRQNADLLLLTIFKNNKI